MPLSQLRGTDLDSISQSTYRSPAYRVLLFDPYADTLSNIVLNKYTQVPLDITPYVVEVQVTISHDTEANQATFNVVGTEIDYRCFMNSYVKVYEGDSRVDEENWPCVFTGIFQGQPGRSNSRGEAYTYQHTAYDRSILYRERRVTSSDAWLPTDADPNLGSICVDLATEDVYGMALDRQEVLFGKFFRSTDIDYGTGELGTQSQNLVTEDEWVINKKLQVVDIPLMEALTHIMQPARRVPAFNGEGKLVSRSVDLDKLPVRVYTNEDVIKSVEIPQNTMNLPTSVKVKGLDFRATRLDYKYQRLMTIGPVTVGMFDAHITTKQSYSDNDEFRAVVDQWGRNVSVQGSLLTGIFKFDSYYSVTVNTINDFSCKVNIYFAGAVAAVAVVTVSLIAYIGLRLLSDSLGQVWPPLGFVFDASATILLMLVMETMRSIGTVQAEVWGTPFEYVYRELEAKANLADTTQWEDNPTEIENYILGTLQDCEELARDELRRQVAQIANRSITLATDLLLEPNDVIELQEEGENCRYYILEVTRTLSRGADPTSDLTVFRVQ